MAFHTLEVRWFFPGSIPHGFNHWFTSLGEPRSVDARVDHYLAGTGPLLGIKVREGSLEIKQRQQEHGRQDFAPALSGMVESWNKWRVAIPADEIEAIQQDRGWLAVEKTRQQYGFTLPESGEIYVRDPEVFPRNGGGVELTQISLDLSSWWTFGIEVFGEPHQLNKILEQVIGYVVDRSVEFDFDAGRSMSYPAWLEQHYHHR